ncbi:pfkB family carbohydrate kinase [Kribbella voronezhensis]|uniref:PfkB family carbohydrate kinase n=1 Tax=Kribbella voronezhensis TaxID=2512212 RepID=A0A4V3FJN7_9ACTN|nr:PfkB family carbohydrate kinase [Kribbella voronezhensis]TDU87093.1 pfkB family carbohydrate kinase [Kribbella voronezhensis]
MVSASATPDVVVLGEILVELSSTEPLDAGVALTLNFSGDALNAAAASAAAGAHTALLARVPDDELGDRLLERVVALGIDTSLVMRVKGQHGLYLQHADPSGAREFTYVRRGSAGSGLGPADVPLELVARAGAVLASGIACAISPSSAEAVQAAAAAARCFVYDPNWRPRLIDANGAAAHLRALAPSTRLVTPAWPREAQLVTTANPAGGPREGADEANVGVASRSGTQALGGGEASDRGGAPGIGEARGGGGAREHGGEGRAGATEHGGEEDGGGGAEEGWAGDPVAVCGALRALGVEAVALTRGVDGVLLDDGGEVVEVAAIAAPVVVDQTGAGDSFAGTVTARLALGDQLIDAVRLGVSAASLSVGGLGGTGRVATLEESQAHAARAVEVCG